MARRPRALVAAFVAAMGGPGPREGTARLAGCVTVIGGGISRERRPRVCHEMLFADLSSESGMDPGFQHGCSCTNDSAGDNRYLFRIANYMLVNHHLEIC